MHAMSPPSHTGRSIPAIADRLGATASFLCAVHCAVLPFVLALLPALGLGFLADHRFERGFIAFATVLALWSIGSGYRRHRRRQAVLLLLPGLVLLWCGALIIDSYGFGAHALLVAMGGLLISGAHITNLGLASARDVA